MNNYLGLLYSLLYFAIIFFFALNIKTKNAEHPRLFFHIMSANWFFIAQYTIESKWIAMSVPAFLFLFHYINNRISFLPKLSSTSSYSRNGFLFTYLSMMILIYFTFDATDLRFVAGMGLLALGYGDGLASLLGMRFGKHHYTIFKGQKSIEGSLVMFISTIIVLSIYLNALAGINPFLSIVSIATLATLSEAISPYGLDNLFIPILSSLLYYIWMF